MIVSVIIPTYKDWPRLKLCLEALAKQTYPADQFEVIVVNNDPEEACPYELPAASMKIITEGKHGSYSARNLGLKAAKGEVIAFTDSDCIPDPFWIENGISCLEIQNSDLAGGYVDFIFKNPDSAAEIIDALGHMDNFKRIMKHKCAVTANLFVKKTVFDAIGSFDGSMRSGADTVFTQKAVSSGFKLVYCASASLKHPTRNFQQGIIKSFRVGTGLLKIEQNRPASAREKVVIILKHLFPIANPWGLRNGMKKYGKRSWVLFFRLLSLSFIYKLAQYLGFLFFIIGLKK